MLDIKFIRENPKKVQQGAGDKGKEINVEHILELDNKVRELESIAQKLREERNKTAKERNIEKGKELKIKLEKQENALRVVAEELKTSLLEIPNLPLGDVPLG